MTAGASRMAGGMPPGGGGNDLAALWAVLPHLPHLLEAWRGRTVGEVAGQFGVPGAAPAPSRALIDAMAGLAAASMGQGTARALRRRLERTPSVLSANHHAIECFPELAQAVHFFGLGELLARPGESTETTESAESTGPAELAGTGAAGQLGEPGAVPPSVAIPGEPRRVIPVLSCTTVSLQSQVYPRGLMHK